MERTRVSPNYQILGKQVVLEAKGVHLQDDREMIIWMTLIKSSLYLENIDIRIDDEDHALLPRSLYGEFDSISDTLINGRGSSTHEEVQVDLCMVNLIVF